MSQQGVIRWVKKILKIIGITIGILLLLMFALPYFFGDTISKKVKTLVNRSIEGKIEFSKARLSFFNHFPSLTLTLYNFTSTGSAPYQNETLLSSKEIAFGIDMAALIRGTIHVNKFFITQADINLLVDEKGNANYNIYKSHSEGTSATSSADTTTAIKIEKIIIEKSNLLYNDLSAEILIDSRGLNYVGKGDLSKAIFDLSSHLTIDSFDLYYDKQPYILKKKINARLITSINTNSLALEFKKNNLRINRLPLRLSGRYEFLRKGYYMNFKLTSVNAGLSDVFSTLPPSYQEWFQKTKIDGNADITATLSGSYIGGTDTMPDLNFSMKVRDGRIEYAKAPVPVSNLFLDFESKLPGLNLDSLSVNVDSIFFNLGKNHFGSVLKIKGYETPYVLARVNSELDLAELDRALGIARYDLKGILMLRFNADGRYATGQNPRGLRKDIIVTSIPAFTLQSSLRNGYLHYTALPKPIEHIDFNIRAECPDNNYHHTSAAIENINIKVLDNYLRGFIRLKNSDDFPIEADLDGICHLSDIQQFYPLDSMDVKGDLVIKIKSAGNYHPAKKMFPRTDATIKIENASLKTKYYPAPLEKIVVSAIVQNKEGTLHDLSVEVQPISFEFEGKPFIVKADLEDFDNIKYDISSKGEVDLGRIYKVFSQKGWDVQGIIITDLSLKGSQADATAHRYGKLYNSGTLKAQNLVAYSDLYPLPFFIDRGIFRFNQDKMVFEGFKVKYGKSIVILDGHFSNLFSYMAGSGPLQGDLQLKSDYILIDELMAYKADGVSARPDSVSAGSSGVIIVPGDLDLKFNADVNNIDFNNLHIKSLKGEVAVQNAEIKLNETGFELAGATTTMNAVYRSLSPAKAGFTYHISMNEFDVNKMYNEVELFRQLAPAAAKAQGIISLDYDLQGKLNADMYPIMPSLAGGGVLSLKEVKMKGFRFFSAISKETGKEKINDPDLSRINFKTIIKNNVVTLEKTKMKVAGFRLRIQGQTSFDGKIKFNCRVGLPPFGIIGIPVKVEGMGTDPKVKVGKTDKLPLEEQQEETADSVMIHN